MSTGLQKTFLAQWMNLHDFYQLDTLQLTQEKGKKLSVLMGD